MMPTDATLTRAARGEEEITDSIAHDGAFGLVVYDVFQYLACRSERCPLWGEAGQNQICEGAKRPSPSTTSSCARKLSRARRPPHRGDCSLRRPRRADIAHHYYCMQRTKPRHQAMQEKAERARERVGRYGARQVPRWPLRRNVSFESSSGFCSHRSLERSNGI